MWWSWLDYCRLCHLISVGEQARHNHRTGVSSMMHRWCCARWRRGYGQIIVVARMGRRRVRVICYLSFWTTRAAIWWVSWWRWCCGCWWWRTQNSWKLCRIISDTLQLTINYLHLLKPWLEFTEIPRVGLWWYDEDERVVEGADDGERRL